MKKIIILLVVFASVSKSYCQVNYQGGSATFGLPMFNWQDDKSRLNFAVNLSYSSGMGLKVNDVASNVGQGWNLFAGGSISRMQVGEPDDQKAYGTTAYDDLTKYPNGYLYTPADPLTGYPYPDYETNVGCPTSLKRYPLFPWDNQLYKNDNATTADREQDRFAFQINGRSGFFVLSKLGPNGDVGLLTEDSKLKVSFTRNEAMANNTITGIRTTISAFTITDENGLIYKFDKYELTKVLSTRYCDISASYVDNQPTFGSNNVYYESGFDLPVINPYVITTWYLSQITDGLTGRTVTFNYNSPALGSGDVANSAGVSLSNIADKDYSILSYNHTKTNTPTIASISCQDGHQVNFNYSSADRIDFPGFKALSSVDVLYNGRYLSRYQFNSAYFMLNRIGMPNNNFQRSVARLCLQSVKKYGVDLKDEEPPYRFEYFTGSNNVSTDPNEQTLGMLEDIIPPPFFHLMDIWGYYNGNNSVDYNGINPVPINTPLSQLNNTQIKGLCFMRNGSSSAALNPKSGYAKNGCLKKIIYPTGGTLSYQYAQNVGVLNGISQNVGGVHVTSSSVTDGSLSGLPNDCNNPIVTNYSYVDDAGQSSLWGLETPVNSEVSSSHYKAEMRKFKWTGLSCIWKFKYPGILSREQAHTLTGGQQLLLAFSTAMQVVSTVMTIIDIVELASVATGPAAVIIDAIAIVAGILFTCTGSAPTVDNTATTHFNSDKNNINPLPLQYKQVTVSESSGSNGKTVMKFTNPDDNYALWIPANANTNFTMEPRFASFAYGLPWITTVYQYDPINNNYIPIKQTTNNYDFSLAYAADPHPGSQNWGVNRFTSCKCVVLKSSSERISPDWQNESSLPVQKASDAEMIVAPYRNQFGHVTLTSTSEKTFKPGSSSVYLENITSYTYNSNYLVTTVSTTRSTGETDIKTIKYNSDFTGGVLDLLTSKNIFSTPVSTQNTISKYNPVTFTTTVKLASETVNEYTFVVNGNVKPQRTLEQRFAIPPTTYSTYLGPGNAGNPTYKETQTFTYKPDASCTLIGLKDEGNHIVTNLYDYNDKYVVASVVNADALVDKPCYSSFEVNGSYGGWAISGTVTQTTSNSVTGSTALTLGTTNSITANINSSKPYILSYWSNNGPMTVANGTLVKTGPVVNLYTYYEYTLTPAATATITNSAVKNIDELRLYPQTSRMRTVTYDPLIGKTTECDENNRLTYYEYDALGRLRYVKDDAKNILKMYEYNYAKKQNGCTTTYSNLKTVEVFYKNNCAAGYIGAPYTYTIPAARYTSTISQEVVDKQVQNELDNLGQTAANTSGACTRQYANLGKTVAFTKNSCGPGYIGGSVNYTVPANIYFSTVSQAAADALEQFDVNANGQAYANTSAGNCTVTTVADWESTDVFQCEFVNGVYTGNQLTQFLDENPNSPTYNTTQMQNTGTTVPTTCAASCALTAAFGWTLTAGSISNGANNTANFYMVVSKPGFSSWSTLTTVASIVGSCYPSVDRTVPYTDASGRTWSVKISSTGYIAIALTGGTAPASGATVSFNVTFTR
ncbi:MAG: hypothetical protein H7211_06485 [Aquabacterium sp.]|nr:hypothetical protein [Ferruginibacter sp.]